MIDLGDELGDYGEPKHDKAPAFGWDRLPEPRNIGRLSDMADKGFMMRMPEKEVWPWPKR